MRPGYKGMMVLGAAAAVLAVAVIGLGFLFGMQAGQLTARTGARPASAPLKAAARSAAVSGDTLVSKMATSAALSLSATRDVASSSATAAPAAPKAVKPRVFPAPSGPTLDAYRGLGSWVDIYDDGAWASPAAAVRDMAGRGVRTLYIETANSRSGSAFKDRAALETFIREAHEHRMKVVAWYLADMVDMGKDYDRIVQAIRFRTSDGQEFDSFALDIESGAIGDVTARNRALGDLSLKIRAVAGKSYPLGAIIPSPVGLSRSGSYWAPFPYTMLARIYDAFVPMSYWTYHGAGWKAAYDDTLGNVRIIRAQKGCSRIPIHLIGGITDKATVPEVEAFVRVARETRCIGAGLYAWPGTSPGMWQKLSAIK
jgi:hypothetical protein